MRNASLTVFRLITSLLFLVIVCHGQEAKPDTTADQTALRQLVTDYFGTYPKRDASATMSFWSAKSPTYDSRKKVMEARNAERDNIQINNFSVRHVNVDGDHAFARVEFELTARIISTGKPAPDPAWSTSTVRYVKEDGQWKIWAHEDGYAVLAQELIDAKTSDAREQLLASEHAEFIPNIIFPLLTIGSNITTEAKYSEAHDILGFGLSLAEKYKKQTLSVYFICRIADVYRYEGNFNDALQQVERARQLSEQWNDKTALFAAYEFSGIIYFAMGEPTESTEYLQKAYDLRETSKATNIRTAEILDSMGACAYLEGNYGKSLELYQKAAEWRKEPEGLLAESSPWNNIGAVYLMTGEYDLALKFFNLSLQWNVQRNRTEMVSLVMGNIGNLYHMREQYDDSLKYFQQSLIYAEQVKAKPRIAWSLQGVSNQYEALGNYDTAQEYLEKAAKLSDEIGQQALSASILANMAELQAKHGKYPEAIANAQRGAELAKKVNDREDVINAHAAEGQAYFKIKQFPQAKKAFAEAIATTESMRADFGSPEEQRGHFLESKLGAYLGMIDLLYTEGKPDEALAMAERAKGRVLLDVLQNGRSKTSKLLTPAERTQEERYLRELTTLNMQLQNALLENKPNQSEVDQLKDKLEKARFDREAFQTGLYAAHPELKVRRGEVDAFDLKHASALIPDSRTAIVEYVAMDDKTLVFVLTKGNSGAADVKVYTLPAGQKELTKSVNDFRERLARRDLSFRGPAQQLFKQLLQPAESQLADKKRLIIVPDGPLWELPFQALILANGHYLIERSAIASVPSISVLYEMERRNLEANRNQTKGKLLAYGNPTIGQDTISRVNMTLRDERLTPLPEAEVEVNSVAKIYGAKESKVNIGAAADEARFKADAGEYRILHLATHGILNNYSPMYSHIVLSRDEKGEEDGLLEAWEIMNLDLKADLVVLSACETARGKYGAGEGIIGLSWALFVAGAPTSVVSQWKIDSVSTTQLMVSFHNELTATDAKGNALFTKAEALQKADLKLLESKQYQHPFYWAGFVVMGDGFQPLRKH